MSTKSGSASSIQEEDRSGKGEYNEKGAFYFLGGRLIGASRNGFVLSRAGARARDSSGKARPEAARSRLHRRSAARVDAAREVRPSGGVGTSSNAEAPATPNQPQVGGSIDANAR